MPKVEQAPDICGLSRIKAMLTELGELQEKLVLLEKSAIELGIA